MGHSIEKKCGNCKFFNTTTDDGSCLDVLYIGAGPEYKPCGLLTTNSKEIDNNLPRALPTDASGYFAALRVKEDFGCVEFISKTVGIKVTNN